MASKPGPEKGPVGFVSVSREALPFPRHLSHNLVRGWGLDAENCGSVPARWLDVWHESRAAWPSQSEPFLLQVGKLTVWKCHGIYSQKPNRNSKDWVLSPCPSLFLCICMYDTCIWYLHMWTWVCMCHNMQWKSKNNVGCRSLPCTWWEIGSHCLPLHYDRQAGPQASSVSTSHLTVGALGLLVYGTTSSFTWVLGIWTQVLLPAYSKCFIHWAISSALFLLTYKLSNDSWEMLCIALTVGCCVRKSQVKIGSMQCYSADRNNNNIIKFTGKWVR